MDKFKVFENDIRNVSHFNSREEILAFLEKNPMWL
jgi:hypothetical protein